MNLRETAMYYVEELENAYNNGELYEYISDSALDVEYTIGSNGNYLGTTFALGLDGSNVYYDTRNSRVEVYWGGEEASVMVDRDVSYELDSFFEEECYMVIGR